MVSFGGSCFIGLLVMGVYRFVILILDLGIKD